MGRVAVLLLLLVVLAFSQQASPQNQLGPSLNWVVESNPSNKEDRALGICHGDEYLYIVGYDEAPGDAEWRIEMRDKKSGRLVKVWTYNPSKGEDRLSDCVVIGDRLYVVGSDVTPGNAEWAILIFDLNLTLLRLERSNPSRGWDWAGWVTTDGKYLYIAGKEDGVWWRVEKRTLNLSLVKTYTSRRAEGSMTGIGINPVTGRIWAVGFVITDKGLVGRIEILTSDLNLSNWFGVLEYIPEGVVFDSEGNSYVYGAFAILKFSSKSELLAYRPNVPAVASVVVGKRLYSLDFAVLNMRELNYLLPLGKNVTIFANVSNIGPIWKAVFDGYSIYLAGTINRTNDHRWLIASVSVPVVVNIIGIDGFGRLRDWGIEVVNSTGGVVARGRGNVTVELLGGRTYVAKVEGLGTQITKSFVASDGLKVSLAIPTALITARAVDGFGRVRDWAVTVVGVAEGRGAVGPVEVLGNKSYTVVVSAFGRVFNKTVYVTPGSVLNATVAVPTAYISARVVDGFKRQREWPVEIVGVGAGVGVVGPVEVLAGQYVVKSSAFGAVFNKTVSVVGGQNATVVVEIPTGLITARVVDGFGAQRDWPIAVVGIAEGRGSVGPVEVLGGRRYVVTAVAFGKNFTEYVDVAAGANQSVVVKVPTGRIAVNVVDGFGRIREWPVEIVGLTSGKGTVGPVEAISGSYTVKARAFNREFSETINVQAGQEIVGVVKVPTAVINVTVLDDERKPLDKYVELVFVNGETYTKPPINLELLADKYQVRVRALGKEVVQEVVLSSGEAKNVEIVVPGTAGVDIGGTRLTYTTLGAIAAGIAASVVAVGIYALKRRKKT